MKISAKWLNRILSAIKVKLSKYKENHATSSQFLLRFHKKSANFPYNANLCTYQIFTYMSIITLTLIFETIFAHMFSSIILFSFLWWKSDIKVDSWNIIIGVVFNCIYDISQVSRNIWGSVKKLGLEITESGWNFMIFTERHCSEIKLLLKTTIFIVSAFTPHYNCLNFISAYCG